ncbi:cytochrome P450 3A15-like [Centruroides vittatus]|uniref:cytochrome P450 3A15-like n=1 Tax=Centruroides vittatus TaxID=120091 RepID=UPI00350EDED7
MVKDPLVVVNEVQNISLMEDEVATVLDYEGMYPSVMIESCVETLLNFIIMKEVANRKQARMILKRAPNLYKILRNDKDRIRTEENTGVYKVPYENIQLNVKKDYIVVTNRSLAVGLKEHRYNVKKGSNATILSQMSQVQGSVVKWDEATIIKPISSPTLSMTAEKMEIYRTEVSSTNRDRKLTSDSILVNIVLLLTARYEAISLTLECYTYYLAYNSKRQDRIRLEINNHIEKNKDIQYEDLIKLQYLDQAISETLRFSSQSVINISRAVEQDFKYKGMTIPKQVAIFVPVAILHRDPNYWHEADKFDPDRFSPENRINISPMTYQPFGAGPRNCVAYRMARTVMKLVMANLIRSFVFDACECGRSEVKHSIFSMREKDSILIKATPISSN